MGFLHETCRVEGSTSRRVLERVGFLAASVDDWLDGFESLVPSLVVTSYSLGVSLHWLDASASCTRRGRRASTEDPRNMSALQTWR